MNWRVEHGDCLDLLRDTLACSVDAVVTDPPYGLSFMGKKWDYDVPSVEVWAECLRVLKPGGHLLAFAGTRTQHRMAVRIEDAGFEIRDMIAWVYGSGFPKSHDVSKAIDREAGVERTTRVGLPYMVPNARAVNPHFVGIADKRDDAPAEIEYCATAPATPAARQWQGWGTALKPALEPITMARKPFRGTVAANVMQHGTGAINVDGCRVGTEIRFNAAAGNTGSSPASIAPINVTGYAGSQVAGRWPANLIHDGSDEVLAGFPGEAEESASRYFYCPKASKADREDGMAGVAGVAGVGCYGDFSDKTRPTHKNHHPTVKPTALMQYLCRLVTPPGGTVLDPFTGSGSTGKAAMLEGFNFIGFEREAEYVEIARRRIAEAAARPMLEGIK
jgi:site-specific DNA-methyltransferase (adenine-specific)